MKEPLRLRHDPDAPADLRHALDAEARFALPHDLARVKAGLTAAVAAGVRPERSAGWSGPGLVTGAVILAAVGAYSLWGHAPPAPASARVEATAPTASTPDQTAPASLAVAASDRVKAPASTPDQTAPAGPVVAASDGAATVAAPTEVGPTEVAQAESTPTVVAQAAAPRPARRARPLPAVPAPQPEPSGLAAELTSYQQAQAALSAGRYGEAAEAFARHRATFPGGRLEREAALGHLEALHRAGRADAAVAQAKALLGAPGLAGRRAEVLRVLAEAEVLRGRCDEARAAFEQAREAGADITEDAVQGALQACARRSPR